MNTSAELSVREIQAALDAGPTDGPWGFAHCTEMNGIATVASCGLYAIGPDYKLPENACYDEHSGCDVDATFIAACCPANMRKVLALLQSQAAEIERMRIALTEIAYKERAAKTGLSDFGESWDKGLFIGTLQGIAQKAIKRRATTQPKG